MGQKTGFVTAHRPVQPADPPLTLLSKFTQYRALFFHETEVTTGDGTQTTDPPAKFIVLDFETLSAGK